MSQTSAEPARYRQPRSVLVTGGAGFIGANLVRRLVASGTEVTVFDNLSEGRPENLTGLELTLIEGDLLDESQVRRAVAGHDAVVHLAAQTGVPGSISDPRRDCAVNVLGTLNVLEAVRSAGDDGGFPRVVFASSNAPLGRQTPPADETSAPLPISPYGASKLAGEGYCLAYSGTWGVPTVVLRFANVYGPHSTKKESVVARFVKDALADRKVTIHGDGQQTRDFIYVEDLCEVIEVALRSGVRGEVFQIATGVETSILELVNSIEQALGFHLERHFEPARRGDMRQNFSRVTKADRLLGWRPRTALSDGLRSTASWFASEQS